MSSLVEKGDKIHVPAEFLGGEKSSKITVTWSQRLQTRNQDYWVCNYTVASGGRSDGVIYVQTDKVDEFKARHTGGEDFTLTVDEKFQYGQNNERTKRFLVFHNTDNWPFQHRFVENTITNLGHTAMDIVRGLGFKDPADCAERFGKSFLGDYLHSY